MSDSVINSGNLQVVPPQTPRSTNHHHSKSGVTPSFSFGLGFSPSFQLSSASKPSNISPRRYLQTANELNRVVNIKNKNNKKEGEGDVFNSLTPPSSSKLATNRFLDSIAFTVGKKGTSDTPNDTVNSQEDSMDIWSSLGNDSNHSHLSSMSMYEDEKAIFLTPNKLFIHKDTDTDREKKLDMVPRLIPIQPKANELEKTNSRIALAFTKPKKKRKTLASSANSLTDSPNNSIASQIDLAIESPSSRKESIASESSDISGDKVWYEELDNVLIKSYLKYIHFRRNQKSDSSILKNTSQNKVLSRMLLNRTGVLRTANQISSRLFRLSKLKKITKARIRGEDSEDDQDGNLSEINGIMSTSLDNLISNTGIDNELIDKELDLIFNSPDLNNELLQSSPIFQEDDRKPSLIELRAKEMSISYKHNFDAKLSHVFTSLESSKKPSLNEIALKKELTDKLKHELPSRIFEKINKENKSIYIVNNMLDMSPASISTASSSITNNPKPFDLAHGDFESYMSMEVKGADTNDSILNWRCLTKVFIKDKLIFEDVEIINGYKCDSNYELQIPFLKQFWPGYLAFVYNGKGPDSLSDLMITQVIFNNENIDFNFNDTSSSVYGIVAHKFCKTTSGKGSSIFIPSESLDDREDDLSDDDNATVLANSSPYKIMSSPINQSLQVDITKANKIMGGGRASAPVYNANVVQRFNQSVLQQQERLKFQVENQVEQRFVPNHAILQDVKSNQPQLMHSQSTSSIPQFPGQIQQNVIRSNSIVGNVGQRMAETPQMSYKDIMTSTPKNVSMQVPIQQQQMQVNSKIIQQPQQTIQRQFIPVAGSFYGSFSKFQDQDIQNTKQFEMHQVSQQKIFMNPADKQSYPGFHSFNQIYSNPYSAPASQTYFFNQQAPPPQQVPSQIPPQQVLQQIPPQPIPHPPVAQLSKAPKTTKATKDSNKENVNPNGIKFGPILEYDPSKDSNQVSQSKSQGAKIGTHRFPINTQVMYKPKKS